LRGGEERCLEEENADTLFRLRSTTKTASIAPPASGASRERSEQSDTSVSRRRAEEERADNASPSAVDDEVVA
jgi:hypothetical protein